MLYNSDGICIETAPLSVLIDVCWVRWTHWWS